MEKSFFNTIGVIAAVCLPLFNIPLIWKIVQRRSSQDFSLSWAAGVWVCILLMAPSGFTSEDVVWKTFNVANIILFTAVFFVIIRFRHGHSR